ncbi:MAG: hypothetical protein ACTHKM_11610 [Tsuneonella sp.]
MTESPLESARRLADQGAVPAALARLIEAESAGDASAAAELGYWYLRGSPVARDVQQTKEHFRRSAALGNADSAAVDIAMTANGSWGEPDWRQALAALRELARSTDWAAEDLALIEAMDLDDHGYPKSPPASQILDSSLPIVRLKNFVSPEERQHIANRAAPHMSRSTVLHPRTGQLIADPVRTSEGTVIGPAEEDLVLQALYRRIARATTASRRC